jgi:hypothetical protein
VSDVPALHVVFRLEEKPVVYVHARASEVERLIDWLVSHAEYWQLVDSAFTLERRERAA